MYMLREAGAAALSTTGNGGYGSLLSHAFAGTTSGDYAFARPVGSHMTAPKSCVWAVLQSKKSQGRPMDALKTKTEASLPPLSFCNQPKPLPQPSRRMREQGVDEAGLRGEVAAKDRGSSVVARDVIEQALKLGNVTVDGLLEAAVGAVLAGDLIEGLLAGRRVEPFCKGLALAALIAIPHLGGEVAVQESGDLERQRPQRIAAGRRLGGAAARDLAVAGAGIGAVQEVG